MISPGDPNGPMGPPQMAAPVGPPDMGGAPVEAAEPVGVDGMPDLPPGWSTDPGQVYAVMARLMGADQRAFAMRQQAAMGISGSLLVQHLGAPQTLDQPGGLIPQPQAQPASPVPPDHMGVG